MPEKWIGGVKPLKQFMEDGSFLMPEIPAAFRALQAMNAPEYMDYDYLLSVSGMAVRLAWQQGWAEYEDVPNQGIFYNERGKSVVGLAFDRIGVQYTVKKISEAGIEAAKSDIRVSIDKGVPALLTGGPNAYTTVLGYRDDELFGVATFADQKKRVPPHDYNCIDDWQNAEKEYILIDAYRPKAMDAELLTDTLKTAVYLARTTRLDSLGDTALGISSFDALAEMLVWDEGFEPLEPGKSYEGEISFPYDRPEGYYRTDGARTLDKRFWAGYCDFLCMLNGYSNFARFLDKYAALLPEHSEQLKEAVTYYGKGCDYSGELWKYVTPNKKGVKKFKNKDVRYAFAAHMLRAKIYTVKAVEILEKIIES
ncbi:MAG: hypothetical protein FWF05_00105 [Oscillospiraceae bacterium]|nr:hypothetical protein [Oscillospiraceae bacterium]